MMPDMWGWAIALVFAAAFLGYLLGRRQGWRDGLAAGEAGAPIRLRELALRAGRCPLCGEPSRQVEDDPSCEEGCGCATMSEGPGRGDRDDQSDDAYDRPKDDGG